MKAENVRVWDWPVAVLVVMLVYIAATRLSLTGWAIGLWRVEGISVLGALLGLALGMSKFKKSALNWLVAGYSLMVLPWVLRGLIEGEHTCIGQFTSLAGRLAVSTVSAWRGEAVTDAIFFISLMSVLFWFIGVLSGYQVSRRWSAFWGILPAMLPLLIVQYYDSSKTGRIWLLGVFFGLAILLLGRLNFIENRQRWQQKRIFAGDEPLFDLTRGLVISAVLVILLAWSAPTPAAAIPAVARVWKEMNRPFEKTRGRLDDLLASLRGSTAFVAGELYGSTMSLGQNARQGDIVIFSVRPSELTTMRPYWRMRVYDTYQDGRWSVTDSTTVPFSPESNELAAIGFAVDKTVNFVFNWQSASSSLLVMPGYPFWVSRAGAIQLNSTSEEVSDVLSWAASTPVVEGDQYQVRAVLANPTIKQMRASPPSYPHWVVEDYLQLPETLSDDIRRLADRLTREYDNNFDKAAAITNYLRAEMKYALEVPPPPLGVDPVDWFLFTWKSGFCNYYASAQVLLLRAAGIPARIAVGYAPGEYQSGGYYQVKAKDAHAWPEVYFSGIGWVEFEPTTSLDVIYRPGGEEWTTDDTEEELSRLRDENRLLRQNDSLVPEDDVSHPSVNQLPSIFFSLRREWLWVIIWLVILSGVVIFIWQLEQRAHVSQKIPHMIKQIYIRYHLNTPRWLENWVRWSEVTAVERAFHAINQSLAWLGKPQPSDVTALERARLLKKLIPDLSEAIDILVTAHEKTLYTPEPVNPAAAMRAAWVIRYHTLRALTWQRFNDGEQSL